MINKIQFLVAFILLFSWLIKAQVHTIELPKDNHDIKVKTTAPFFSIYVDANNTVYLEKEPIDFHAIAKT
jgi:biopolymer transport protein ExbD